MDLTYRYTKGFNPSAEHFKQRNNILKPAMEHSNQHIKRSKQHTERIKQHKELIKQRTELIKQRTELT